jgi:phytanoyl-CoA hydroxylase
LPYPKATPEEISFFAEHGYLVVEDAVAPGDLDELIARCDTLIEKKEKVAFDWAWEKGKSKDEREFLILQSSPTVLWPEFVRNSGFNAWAVEFASALMGKKLEFWYDQFLAKPPKKGAATLWHQDEAYWGRNLDDRGITCWMPFHDVDASNGCMHFIDGGHKIGVLPHRQPEGVQSDLLVCAPDESKTVVCPIRKGSVTFHHSKMPHMTTPNGTDSWRKILSQHLREVGVTGEGDHYPWKVYVNQYTGDRIKPPSR